ncbi:hypothetical protein [Actinocatenispora comari]|uniref:Uncharacterized protein n=1 Tax=Actinocatenispora comari TaxID=2807577 RepID=A0A8J4A8X2_9ACTN|nr:hypothetical protein [Actinocatenispora comari]GIL25475.1 hypothetical protein NUM_07300 [Actinocatenispora comari]
MDEMLEEPSGQQTQTGLLALQTAAGCPDPSRAARLALTAAGAFCNAARADGIDLPAPADRHAAVAVAVASA